MRTNIEVKKNPKWYLKVEDNMREQYMKTEKSFNGKDINKGGKKTSKQKQTSWNKDLDRNIILDLKTGKRMGTIYVDSVTRLLSLL